jgi:hypothetical protein
VVRRRVHGRGVHGIELELHHSEAIEPAEAASPGGAAVSGAIDGGRARPGNLKASRRRAEPPGCRAHLRRRCSRRTALRRRPPSVPRQTEARLPDRPCFRCPRPRSPRRRLACLGRRCSHRTTDKSGAIAKRLRSCGPRRSRAHGSERAQGG